jgi:hypothetical protein
MPGGERNAGANLADRLIDKRYGALTMSAFVRLGRIQFGAGVLQQSESRIHVGLRA